MERIKQLLQEQGKQIADDAIKTKLSEYGLDGSTLSEADAKTIAKELEPEAQPLANLAVSNGKASTPAPKPTSSRRKNAKSVSLKDAMVHAAKQTETEVGTMEDTIRQHKTQYIEQRSQSLVNEIRNTSTEIVDAFTDKLMEEKADAETFHEIGNQFGEGLFPSFA